LGQKKQEKVGCFGGGPKKGGAKTGKAGKGLTTTPLIPGGGVGGFPNPPPKGLNTKEDYPGEKQYWVRHGYIPKTVTETTKKGFFFGAKGAGGKTKRKIINLGAERWEAGAAGKNLGKTQPKKEKKKGRGPRTLGKGGPPLKTKKRNPGGKVGAIRVFVLFVDNMFWG